MLLRSSCSGSGGSGSCSGFGACGGARQTEVAAGGLLRYYEPSVSSTIFEP